MYLSKSYVALMGLAGPGPQNVPLLPHPWCRVPLPHYTVGDAPILSSTSFPCPPPCLDHTISKVAPVMCKLLLMCTALCGLVPDGLKRMNSKGKLEKNTKEGDDDLSDDAQIGPGNNEGKSFVAVDRRRINRGVQFMTDIFSPVKMIIWQCCGGSTLVMHFRLFKASQAASHRGHVSDSFGTSLYNLCNWDTSPAVAIMRQLGTMFISGHADFAKHWNLLILFLNGLRVWPQPILHWARSSLMTILGNVWRRLVLPFFVWPFLLVGLFNPELSQEKKPEILDKFLDTRWCCLDLGVGKKLFNLIKKAKDFWDN